MEGPPVHALVDDLAPLRGQTVEAVRGNARQPLEDLEGRTITRLEAVKKRVLVGDDEVGAVLHFLVYGSHRWNERRTTSRCAWASSAPGTSGTRTTRPPGSGGRADPR